jgi:ESCRT-II complex subunit VPS36
MGVIFPMTRSIADSTDNYYEGIAREIGNIMLEGQSLLRLGGMMTLTDLYCVYNTARGMDLISPNDLLKAVEKLDNMGLGIELKVLFPLSLTVIKLRSIDEKHICSKLVSLCGKKDDSFSSTGLDYLAVARALNISIDIAQAQLRIAMDSGYICEDSYLYGTYYFQNLFDSFS